MKYLSEYQRSYYKRTPEPGQAEKSNEVPIKRSSSSSPSRRRGRSVPLSPDRRNSNENYAVIGPNDKLSESRLYRLKEPIKNPTRVAKSQEYAILGRNEKLENNVTYPLRKPVVSNSPRVVVRRRKNPKHSCGTQAELGRATSASYDSRYRQDDNIRRKQYNPQSEYRTQYNWKTSSTEQLFEDSKSYEQSTKPPAVKPPEKASVAVNTPARVEIDVNKPRKQAKRVGRSPAKAPRPKRDETTEYRARYVPKTNPAHHTEQKPRENLNNERAYSDDEGLSGNVDLGTEFRQKYPHGKLRRWKSEYQATYKPFWRFDYKNGKWYKDNSANETGFNPNLFWYKELLNTRQRADQYRANAETDHFNPNHTLQLQTGFNLNKNDRAWDEDEDDESVISVDRDLERERFEGQRRRERDAKQSEVEQVPSRKHPKRVDHDFDLQRTKPSQADQIAQTEHQVDRVIYVDEPPPKQPSAATKAFVRNLDSTSVQQQMSWDSESLCTQRTNSDRNSHRKNQNQILHPSPAKKQESRGTRIYSPLPTDRPKAASPKKPERIPPREAHPIRPTTGRPSYETRPFETRPQTSNNQYCTYPGSRFKDEVTEYYYGNEENRSTPVAKPSFQNRVDSLDQQYARQKDDDDDVLSVHSARSLSSSCSLASQTLSRAQQNMNKYWGAQPSEKP